MCSPKSKGGMGFKSFTMQNSSLLSKQAWRLIQSPNEFWVQIIRGVYCNREEFWKVRPKAGSSWVWRSIFHGRDLLKSNGRWTVGTGQNISIEEDQWLTNDKKTTLINDSNLSKVSDIIDPITHSWNTEVLRQNLNHRAAYEVLKVPICWSSTEDKLTWPNSKDGNCTVKSGYWSMRECLNYQNNNPTSSYIHSEVSWKNLWKSKVPERIKQFIWRVKHNEIPTKANLYNKRIAISHRCPVCEDAEESLEHMLLICPWTTPIWFTFNMCSVPNLGNIRSVAKWLDMFLEPSNPMCSTTIEGSEIAFMALWSIWK